MGNLFSAFFTDPNQPYFELGARLPPVVVDAINMDDAVYLRSQSCRDHLVKLFAEDTVDSAVAKLPAQNTDRMDDIEPFVQALLHRDTPAPPLWKSKILDGQKFQQT